MNNMYAACMSPSGNLQVFIKMDEEGTSRQLYESGTSCETVEGCMAKMDGSDFVLYDFINNKQLKKLASGATRVTMQCDGNFVAYNIWDPKWAANTAQDPNYPLDSNALPSKVEKPHTFY